MDDFLVAMICALLFVIALIGVFYVVQENYNNKCYQNGGVVVNGGQDCWANGNYLKI